MTVKGMRTARGRRGSVRRHSAVGAAPRTVGRGKRDAMNPKELRRMTQLLVCAAIFVSIVAARLVLPQKMNQLSENLRSVLGQNIQVQEVFSAVGRAAAGESSVGETMGEVYQAVFGSEEGEAVETSAKAQIDQPQRNADDNSPAGQEMAQLAQSLVTKQEETIPAQPPQEAPSQPENAVLTAVSLVYSNLPKNVCMEQQILGFSYTSPVVAPCSSAFGYREHPVEGEEKFHYGLDLAAADGSDIVSFADGTVTAVGESSSLGKYAVVEHGNGYSTLYAHCSKVTVSSGATVSKGGKIAQVGETGQVTGPHLHFELHRDSNYLNPIYYVETA